MMDEIQAHLIGNNVAEFIQNRLQCRVIHEVERTLKWAGGESKTNPASPEEQQISVWI